jgi:glycosyltransferase involved in cell wall biosynthesis
MKIAFLLAGLPSYGNHGGALTCMGILQQMRASGHDVTIVSLYDTSPNYPYEPYREQNEVDIRALSVNIKYLSYNLDTLVKTHRSQTIPQKLLANLSPTAPRYWGKYYPWFGLQGYVQDTLKDIKPDAIFAYHFEPLAALYEQTIAPSVVSVGDLSHLPDYFRWRMLSPRPTLKYLKTSLQTWRSSNIYPLIMQKLLQDNTIHGTFIPHYAEWLRKHGVPDCQYFRTPVPDPISKDWQSARTDLHNEKPKVIMVGVLGGTATTSGLKLFAEDVLPRLESALGEDGFEVHIIGKGNPPLDVMALLDRPSVQLRGQIEPAKAEFLSANVMLVPTTITLGIRVRILAGFAHGCCIVTHRANTAGIPELKHGENALIGDDGESLATHIIDVLKDEITRRYIQANARKTYEMLFSPETAGQVIVNQLESIVH